MEGTVHAVQATSWPGSVCVRVVGTVLGVIFSWRVAAMTGSITTKVSFHSRSAFWRKNILVISLLNFVRLFSSNYKLKIRWNIAVTSNDSPCEEGNARCLHDLVVNLESKSSCFQLEICLIRGVFPLFLEAEMHK